MKCAKCGKEFPYGKSCPFCGNTEISISESDTIPVLTNEPKKRRLKKMDKIIIIIVAAVLVIAVVVAAVVIKSKNKKNEPQDNIVPEATGELSENNSDKTFEPVTFSEDVSVTFSGVTTDYAAEMEDFTLQSSLATAMRPEASTLFSQQSTSGSTSAAKPTTPTVTPEQHLEATTIKTNTPAQSSNNATKVISAFFNGKYYLDGSMISDSEKTPMEIAMNGADFEVFSEMEGTDIAVLNLGGKLYLLNPETKKYAEINSAVKKMMGMDEDAFEFSFNKIKFDPNAPASITEATYNGKKATCYTYKNDETTIEFIAVNDEIKQMAMYDKNGKADTILIADEFTAEIPSNMLTLKGYSKQNIISFMSSMM